MNERIDLRLDKATFLDWIQRQDRRYELVRGRVVMRQGGTFNHSRIATQLATLVMAQVETTRWAVLVCDFAVDVGDSVRFPDVLVVAVPEDGSVLSTDRPVVLVEVLSPSSVQTDFRDKADEYLSLDSLEAYLILAQDSANAWIWQRGEAEGGSPDLPRQARQIGGLDGRIELPAIGAALALSDIYAGILPPKARG
jgi:Uma2 family endonuclease